MIDEIAEGVVGLVANAVVSVLGAVVDAVGSVGEFIGVAADVADIAMPGTDGKQEERPPAPPPA